MICVIISMICVTMLRICMIMLRICMIMLMIYFTDRETAVVLSGAIDEASSYINANYISVSYCYLIHC